jgi:hypothetical protein
MHSTARTITRMAVAGVVLLAGCGRDSSKTDAALQSDLSLAARQQYQPLDSLSALEAGRAGAAASVPGTARTAVSTTRRTSTARTSTASSSGSSRTGSSGGTVTSTSGGEVTVKHTKRDAAIGAAAGAIIGATTSRDKVKGGLIGAAVGGIIGGVIGNNVDVQKKKKGGGN